MVLPSYSHILRNLVLTDEKYKLMNWTFEMRLFNFQGDFISNSRISVNTQIINNENSTVVSDSETRNSQNPFLREDSKFDWINFLFNELAVHERFFMDIIVKFNEIFHHKHNKLQISSNNSDNNYNLVFREYEKLKEFLFQTMMSFYKDFIKKIISQTKNLFDIYEEIRNLLDEILLSEKFCFYSILMRTANISSHYNQIALKTEIENPINQNIDYCDIHSAFKLVFTESFSEQCIQVLKTLKKKFTPRNKFLQIIALKELLSKEIFQKIKKELAYQINFDADHIITIFVFLICSMNEASVINELMFMEELLSYHWKETIRDSYFYVSFKTAIHFLLKKGRLNTFSQEKMDSCESVFRVK